MKRVSTTPRWLLFHYQLPVRASKASVSIWFRLESLGALALKNSVHVLPHSSGAGKELDGIKRDIIGRKGRASIVVRDRPDGISSQELTALFLDARRKDYQSLRADASWLLRLWKAHPLDSIGDRRQRLLQFFRARFTRIDATDFFRAKGREEAAVMVAKLAHFVEQA